MWHEDWLFRDPLASKMRRLKYSLMLKWGSECLSPAFLTLQRYFALIIT